MLGNSLLLLHLWTLEGFYDSLIRYKNQGPFPERRNNSIPGINVPYFRDNFISGINSVAERRNNAIKGIILG